MKIARSRPVKVFLVAVVLSLSGIYFLCDYYLQSIGHELMLNWVRSESALIQEGNLLTSATKTQRFLLSSDYIQAIKLVNITDNLITERLHFGRSFEISKLPQLISEITIERIGFLHSRAFYQIPNRSNMVIIFDVESRMLNSVFFGGAAFLLLMVIGLVATIRFVEEREFKKREELFKFALNDFITKDAPSEVVEKELPTLMTWWRDKKNQVVQAQELAIKNQSKIVLGEIASRVGHDIVGSVRNAEILSKRASWANQKHLELFQESLDKIKAIASDISRHSKSNIQSAAAVFESFDLVQHLEYIVKQKQIQYEGRFLIQFSNLTDHAALDFKADKLELERSLSNLINNSLEASSDGATVTVQISATNEKVIIEIIDSGKGISSDILEKIGTKNFSFGKENGTGIGVFYARQFVENLGGSLKITSTLKRGTTVALNFPRNLFSFPHKIELVAGKSLLVLEDQDLIRQSIRLKFKNAGLKESQYVIFTTPSELESWLATNKDFFKLYSDHFLDNVSETGIQVIKRLGISDKSVLFTSAFDDAAVLQSASEVGVDVISKDEFFGSKVTVREL